MRPRAIAVPFRAWESRRIVYLCRDTLPGSALVIGTVAGGAPIGGAVGLQTRRWRCRQGVAMDRSESQIK